MDNEKIIQIAKEDQLDRALYFAGELTESDLHKRDRIRLLQVDEFVKSGKVITATDFEKAAIVFQHGRKASGERDTYASGMAVQMMRKALDINPDGNRWLFAAAIDRDLMIRGLPQIYGTQYTRKSETAPWEFYQLDSGQVSDEERKHHFVETLEEQKDKLFFMNKKKLLSTYQQSLDIENLISSFEGKDIRSSLYNLSQEGINTFAYQLIKVEKLEDAIKVFAWNTRLYPHEYDTFHGLGDGYLKAKQFDLAIESFEKCLRLKPDFKLAETDLAKAKKQLKS